MPEALETVRLPGSMSPVAQGNLASGRLRNVWMLPLLLTGQSLAAMDTAIVNVAAPALRADLETSGSFLQMIVAGYGLSYAIFLITGARLGDLYGYRRLFVLGVALFTASSLICGAAPNADALIAGRLAQGAGAALMVPQVLSLIQLSFTGQDKARAVGYYSMVLGLGAAAGQLLGGVAVSFDLWGLGWRPAFLINVPIGLALIVFAPSVLPQVRNSLRRKLDVAGVVLLAVSAALIIVPLTFGREFGWPDAVWVTFALGAAGLVFFWFHEVSLGARGGTPLLDSAALLARGVRPGLAIVVIGFIGYGGWLFAVALYLQSGVGLRPVESGLVFAAYALGFGVSKIAWSKLPRRILQWAPTTALATLALASLWFGQIAGAYGWVPLPMVSLLFLAGCGHGLSFGTTVHRMTTNTPPHYAPALSGMVTTASQISIVTGVATLGGLYLSSAKAAPSVDTANRAMAHVAFAISVAALIALVCSLRLPSIPASEDCPV